MSSVWIYGMSFILALCSILYELLIAQAISFLAHNTVIWYSLTIGLYLAAMGVGALCADKFIRRKPADRCLFSLEIFLSVAGALSVILIYASHMLSSFLWSKNLFLPGFFVFVLMAFILVVGIGFMTGMEIPLLAEIAGKNKDKNISVNSILVFDYFGSLVGAVSFPLILLPRFELITIAIAISLCNVAVALCVLYKTRTQSFIYKIAAFGVLSILIVGIVCHKTIQTYFVRHYYYSNYSDKSLLEIFYPIRTDLSVKRIHSPYQKIDVVEVPPISEPYQQLIEIYSNKYKKDPSFPKDIILCLDGSFQIWSNFEEVYHEYFAHVPVIFQGKVPRNILVLGAGDGLLMRELVKYQQVQSIDWVELDPAMIDLAKNDSVFKQMNKDVFKDQRIHLTVADGYSFVRNSTKTYDAIYIDFPSPNNYNLSKLYSVEFYSFIKRRLTSDGFAVLDAPEAALQNLDDVSAPVDQDIYFQTLKKAGFHTVLPYFSNLESNHKVAEKVLWNFLDDTQALTVLEATLGNVSSVKIQGKKAIAERLLKDFTHDYRQRFFFIKKEDGEVQKSFRNYGIDLNVLNSERFLLSRVNEQHVPPKENKRINTIFRPALPDLSYFWRLKSPY